MSLKLFFIAFAASLLMLSPVHAEEGGAEQGVAPSPVEEKVRAYRQRFDQREMQDEQRQAEFERRREASRKRYEARQKYYNEKMQERLTMIEQQQQQAQQQQQQQRTHAA